MKDFSGVVQSKLPHIGTTIFSVMSKMAQDHGAINLSQGFPDFDCSPVLTELVNDAMKSGFNQYAPMPGLPILRDAIAEKTESLYGLKINPETEITVTSGATQAIFTAISAVIREDDEVIIFEPAYDCYEPAVTMNGGKCVYLQLAAPEYSINWENVKKVINHRTKMIIINSPHNPAGSILSAADLGKLEKLTKNSDIIIISDEVYEHMVFDGRTHHSVLTNPKLAERSFVISSFGKTVHTTGWKIGYCIAPKNLMVEFRKVHQFVVFSANTPMQHALAKFISDKKNYLELSDFYQIKRDKFISLIKSSRFTYTPASGTYFQLLNYSKISDEKDVKFAERLVKDFKLASIPVSVFYHKPVDNKMLRFCFAKKDETLEKAAEVLCRI